MQCFLEGFHAVLVGENLCESTMTRLDEKFVTLVRRLREIPSTYR
jgi:hypothetical protein